MNMDTVKAPLQIVVFLLLGFLASIPLIATADEPAPVPKLVLTANGLTTNGLTVIPLNLKLTKEALGKLFPGLRVEESSYWEEGYEFFEYAVYNGKKKIITLGPRNGTVNYITVLDKQIEGSKGLRIGKKYKHLTKIGSVDCSRGDEGNYGKAYCSVEGIASLYFVLNIGRECIDELVPPKCLKRERIVQLGWHR